MTNIIDNGPKPTVVNIEDLTLGNDNFRTTLWTGVNLQMTLMAIEPGKDIGLEVHEDNDQFLRVEQGEARVSIGTDKDNMQTWQATDDFGIFIPAGLWHNLENVGDKTLKLYSIYSPVHHPHSTVHITRAESDEAEAAEEAEKAK